MSAARRGWLAPAVAGGLALGLTAAVVAARARQAERDRPPNGRFMDIGDTRLHYLDVGAGPPIVFFHGDGSLIQDFTISGLVEGLAADHRVIVFDRPGYGYSTRPHRGLGPERQAALLGEALARLRVDHPLVCGHSWGALVAVALALANPGRLRGLVLVSGYYFPTARLDAAVMAVPAIPVIGDVMRYTVSAVTSRLLLPGFIRKLFAPAPVTQAFDALFPNEMVLRPWQLKAAADDAGLLIPAAARLQHRYRELSLPVLIVSGADDRLIDPQAQSARLHATLPHSRYVCVAGAGHMVHHTAPNQVLAAIRETLRQTATD